MVMTQKQVYCYVIIQSRNGRMILISGKLPIYWNHAVAKTTSQKFEGTEVIRIKCEDIEKLIEKK